MLLPKILTHRPGVAAAGPGSARQSVADGRFAALPVTLRFWDGSLLTSAARRTRPSSRSATRARSPTSCTPRTRSGWRAPGSPARWPSTTTASSRPCCACAASSASLRLTPRERVRLVAAAVRIAGPGVLRRPPVPSIEAQRPGRLHSLGRDRAAIRHHYDVSNRFYRLLLGPEPRLLVRLLRRPGRVARGRPGAQARADLPQAAPRPRRAAARHRLRLGLAADPRRRAPRRARRRRHPLGVPGPARARADRGRRPVRPDRDPRQRLPRDHRRPVRQDRQRRHVRARRPRRSSIPTRAPCTTCCGPAGCSSTTASRACTPSRRRRTRS